jgi:hypothetical protein
MPAATDAASAPAVHVAPSFSTPCVQPTPSRSREPGSGSSGLPNRCEVLWRRGREGREVDAVGGVASEAPPQTAQCHVVLHRAASRCRPVAGDPTFRDLPMANWADLHTALFSASHCRSPRRGRHIVATGASPWFADRHGPNPRRGWHIALGREPAATLTLPAQQGNASCATWCIVGLAPSSGYAATLAGARFPLPAPPRVCTRGYYMPPSARAPERPPRVPTRCPRLASNG